VNEDNNHSARDNPEAEFPCNHKERGADNEQSRVHGRMVHRDSDEDFEERRSAAIAEVQDSGLDLELREPQMNNLVDRAVADDVSKENSPARHGDSREPSSARRLPPNAEESIVAAPRRACHFECSYWW